MAVTLWTTSYILLLIETLEGIPLSQTLNLHLLSTHTTRSILPFTRSHFGLGLSRNPTCKVIKRVNGSMQESPSFRRASGFMLHWISAIKSIIGRSFLNLKAHRYNHDNACHSDASCNKDAFAIANNLSGLLQLRLFGNKLNEQRMHAILDGWPLLQSLDVRPYFQLDFGDDLKDRCKGFASLKLPLDSLHDYPCHVYYISEEEEEEINSLDTCSYAQDGFGTDGSDWWYIFCFFFDALTFICMLYLLLWWLIWIDDWLFYY